jgi:hypothetical protein
MPRGWPSCPRTFSWLGGSAVRGLRCRVSGNASGCITVLRVVWTVIVCHELLILVFVSAMSVSYSVSCSRTGSFVRWSVLKHPSWRVLMSLLSEPWIYVW